MQEALHYGRVVREYRELKVGITQEELANRIGRSRRTIVSLEQGAKISDMKLRRTLAWALQIPPQLLGLSDDALTDAVVLKPLEQTVEMGAKNLNRVVLETFNDNLRMRLDLYYLGSALGADGGLNAHIDELTRLGQKASHKDQRVLLTLLSHNYQLKGMIARDQLDYSTAGSCFKQASLLAQDAESPELNGLTIARQAVMYVWQNRFTEASRLYETVREITKRGSPGLRAYLATGHAEVQGLLHDKSCLVSLTEARSLLIRVDPEDDNLLLLHSTRCSERSINDGWSQCHSLIGMPDMAIESYEKAEKVLDLSMTRMRARLYTQYAEALFASRDMSCCFYALEALKLARSVRSPRNIQRMKELASKLHALFPRDGRVKELLLAL